MTNEQFESAQDALATKPSADQRLVKSSKAWRHGFSKNGELRGKTLIYISAFLIILATVSITVFLTLQGLRAFIIDHVNPIQFLTSLNWDPTGSHPSFGSLAFIIGSSAVTVGAAIIAAPIGIGSAIFMTEIAKKWGQKVIQPIIEILVGIPSVVYGFIGLSVIVPFLSNQFGGNGYGILAGSIVVGVMILPTVTSIAADAIKAVPVELRQASYALGGTRWQTIYKVIIPSALPSILTAIVLGMARAFGEALAVQMVIGNTKGLPHALSVVEPTSTLTTTITLSMGETVSGSALNDILWSLGLILLVMSYIFIFAIRFITRRRHTA